MNPEYTESLCVLCEEPSTGDFCDLCITFKGKSYEESSDEMRTVRNAKPKLQAPVRTDDLALHMGVVREAEDYLLKVRVGENPELPRFNFGAPGLETLDLEYKYPFKEKVAGSQVCYGTKIPGLDSTNDLLVAKSLILADINFPPGDRRYEVIRNRVYPTYFITLDRAVLLWGTPRRIDKMYLRDEEERLFVTYESRNYSEVRVSNYDTVAHEFWSLELSLLPLQATYPFEDFLLFKLVIATIPGSLPDTVAEASVGSASYIPSHMIQTIARPRASKVIVTRNRFPCMVHGPGTPDRGITHRGYLVKSKGHKSLIPEVSDFRRMKPSEKTKVGRVMIDGQPNMIITPPLTANYTRVVRDAAGELRLVKYEEPDHTTCFVNREAGPFVALALVFSKRTTDSLRFAVSLETLENHTLTDVGYCTYVLYDEIDEAPYVSTNRVFEHPDGTFIKKIETKNETQRECDEAIAQVMKDVGPVDLYRSQRRSKQGTTGTQAVSQLFYELPIRSPQLLEVLRKPPFGISETLVLPVPVSTQTNKASPVPEAYVGGDAPMPALDFMEL